MVGATQFRTKADDCRFDLIREIGCIASAMEFWPGTPCEVHHLLRGYRIGHQATIGLSVWHHRGRVMDVFNGDVEAMTLAYGPSLAHDSRAFHARYGSDEELLQIQDALIRIVERAHRKHEYLPAEDIAECVRALHREICK